MSEKTVTCILCKDLLHDGSEIVTLREKGCTTILQVSRERGESIRTTPGQKVHATYRRNYCNKFYITREKRKRSGSYDTCSKRRLRSDEAEFSYKHNCLFCGQGDKYKGKSSPHKLIPVRTKDFQQSIIQICEERKDEWSEIVIARIIFAQDLRAVDAQYHQKCSSNFRTIKQLPLDFQGQEGFQRPKYGRPEDTGKLTAFEKVITYLEENCDKQTTLSDLIAEMSTYSPDAPNNCYGKKHMKNKLIEHFGDRIIVTELCGKETVVTLKSTAERLLHEFYLSPRNTDTEAEKIKILTTAAKLLQNDIKSMKTDCDSYPTCQEIGSIEGNLHYLPASLLHLLQELFVSKKSDLKIASIGQAIMQATAPRIMTSPLQIGLGVQLHHHFGSRFLIDCLNKHGFCSSYAEVTKFEKMQQLPKELIFLTLHQAAVFNLLQIMWTTM